MAFYEYRCQVCDDRFELSRPMSESDAPAVCPSGHTETVRLLSMFAASTGAAPTRGTPAPSGGGCGGACACAH